MAQTLDTNWKVSDNVSNNHRANFNHNFVTQWFKLDLTVCDYILNFFQHNTAVPDFITHLH